MGIPIKGFERYTIERDGTITNTKTQKILKPIYANNGYVHADLHDGKGNHKIQLVHRLVAEHFIPNPDNLPCVNHKDEDPHNNEADNLEWCSYEYNANYGTAPERRRASMDPFYKSEKIKVQARVNGEKRGKPVIQLTKSGEMVRTYGSGKEAARETGANGSHILECCRGSRRSAGGYVWQFERS